jgi:flagellar biosynthesis protein FlhG
MVNLVPIASGKGGVGKSVFAANLGLALARSGKSVVLVDLDLGGSNLHTCLGLRNRHAGIGSLVWKQEKTLSNLLLETGYERLWFVPGDGLQPGTANLEWFTKRRIIKELVALPADFVLLDLGAGSSYNVVDFFLTASDGIVVITPEITSVLNAYSFLKTAAFRLLFRSFADKSEGRAAVQEFASGNVEAAGPSFMDFARGLAARFPEEGGAALERLGALKPRAVMNASSDTGDAELGYRLRDIAAKNLGIGVEFAGYLLADPAVPRSIASRRPVLDLEPDSPFSRGITAVAARIASSAGALEEARGAAHDMAPASRLHEALGPEPLEAIDCSLEAPAGRAAEAVAGAVAGDRGAAR